tara:strand:- start:13657 stop:14508 length:852 start_codon:yes stop_codon:yes gene_type:complete
LVRRRQISTDQIEPECVVLLPAVLSYPAIDPILVEIGPFAIRWYALAYIAGLLMGWRYVVALTRLPQSPLEKQDVDDFIVWATFGVILGGRIGYTLFYRPDYYLAHPLEILFVWQGGMSFHGGLIGVIVAVWWFSRRRGLSTLGVGDYIACAAPIGLFFGRIANFINAELFGRTSDVAWAMVFPRGGPQPRHPSQLYEALLEGALLLVVLAILVRKDRIRLRRGTLFGLFLAGYGATRAFAELFREPDAHLGFLLAGLTMGQLLSVPVILLGIYLVSRAKSPT